MVKKSQLVILIKKLSDSYKKIIPRTEIAKHPEINWGNNGVGDRFSRKIFNYTVIKKSGEYKTYSDNDEVIEEKEITEFVNKLEETIPPLRGIVGIKIHSLKTTNTSRPIRDDIKEHYKKLCCVVCGSKSDLVCDHKNDLYNDPRVLNMKTQQLEDFQTLCTHCNLQKRQVCKKEKETTNGTTAIYSGNNIPIIAVFEPQETNNRNEAFWYDPVIYCKKIKAKYDKQIKELMEENKKLKELMESIPMESIPKEFIL
jgi:hypothetical protein